MTKQARSKLRRGVHSYLRVVKAIAYQSLCQPLVRAVAVDTLRSLYIEFGRPAVRAEISKQRLRLAG